MRDITEKETQPSANDYLRGRVYAFSQEGMTQDQSFAAAAMEVQAAQAATLERIAKALEQIAKVHADPLGSSDFVRMYNAIEDKRTERDREVDEKMADAAFSELIKEGN